MLLNDILREATVPNIQVLKDCTDLVVKNMPREFPVGSNQHIDGFHLIGLDKLVQKYKDSPFRDIIQNMYHHIIIFRNSPQIHTIAGSYAAKPHMSFRFDISAFLQESRDITREELLNWRSEDLPIKTFRGIILHEVRHMFQSELYPEYYHKPEPENYRSSPVELDAAWSHHLQDYDPHSYPNAQSYTSAVMGSFAAYKKLRGFERKRYRNKTAAYWHAIISGQIPDNLQIPAKERLLLRRTEFKNQVLPAIAKISQRDYDLRSLPGYNPESTRFFLGVSVIKTIANIINSDKPVSAANAPIVFLVMALAQVPDLKTTERHLRNVQKITLQQALDNLDTTFGGGWDTAAIRAFLEQKFR
jgi:hypothetical protein